jgi:hypothetical protein
MRTTLTIHDALLRRAREASVQRNCSIGEVIEDALRASLAAQPKSARSSPGRPLKTFKGSGVLPGVDLGSSASLLDAMEGR